MSLRMTKAVWKCSKAKGPARLVLLALADHADEEGRAWPSAARLARYTLIDVRNVHRALAKLVDQGEIIPVGKGKRGVIVYRLTPGNQPEPMTKSPEVEHTDLWRNRHMSNSSDDDFGMEPLAKSSGAPLAKSPDKQSIKQSLEPSIAAAAKQAVELFNSLAEELGLRPVQRLTENRRAQLISRLADIGGITGWQLALDKVRETPGLHAGDGWRITFDWLASEQNLTRILEGQYDGWDPSNPRNGDGRVSRRRANHDAFFTGLAAAARGKRDA